MKGNSEFNNCFLIYAVEENGANLEPLAMELKPTSTYNIIFKHLKGFSIMDFLLYNF